MLDNKQKQRNAFDNSSNKKTGWWKRELSPTASLFFLTISIVVIFVLGFLFINEYLNIWTEILKPI